MKSLLHRIATAPVAMTVLLLVVALSVGTLMSRQFLDLTYLLDKTSLYVPVGFMALSMTFVIVAGQIDLSVASGAVLVMVASARAYELGAPMAAVVPMALLLGMTLGLINGLITVALRLPSLVVTLGTLALYRGLAQVLVGERTIGGFPSWFIGVDYIKLLRLLPAPVILLMAASVVAGISLRFTTFGRKVVAIGTNEEAARYSGVHVARVKMAVFVLSGLSMGIAALIMMSMLRTVDHKQFRGGELVAITAVVLGGTSIRGGRGSIFGTALALGLLVVVRSAMGVANVRAENQLAVVGTLLVGAVVLSGVLSKYLASTQSKRRLQASS